MEFPDYMSPTPESFTGKFDTDAIEVRLNNQALPLQEVIWDKESSFIEIVLEEPFFGN